MDNNTLTAGVSPDGIKNRTDIRILICYMLDQFPDPLTQDDILSLIMINKYANYIETFSAIEHLIDNEHIMRNEKTGALLLSPLGKRVSDDLSERLPYSIRKKSHAAIEKLINRKHNERDNAFISDKEDSGYRVTCVIGGKIPQEGQMSVTCFLPTSERVSEVRERFFDDPEGLYRAVYAQMTGDETLLRRD